MTADAEQDAPRGRVEAKPGRWAALLRARPELVLAPLLLVAIVGTWEYGVVFFHTPSYVLPPPSAIAFALWQGLDAGLCLSSLQHKLASQAQTTSLVVRERVPGRMSDEPFDETLRDMVIASP